MHTEVTLLIPKGAEEFQYPHVSEFRAAHFFNIVELKIHTYVMWQSSLKLV